MAEQELAQLKTQVYKDPRPASHFDRYHARARRRGGFRPKSQLLKPPMQFIYRHGGVFPVRRGHRDEEAFTTAEIILRQGGLITIYPEAGRSRTGKLAEHAKPGVGRLALDSGAPVVPVAIHGTLKARNWKRLH